MTQKSLLQSAGDGTAVPTGYVGEVLKQTRAIGSALSLTSGIPTNITSITLPAGNWLICANINFVGASATTIGANTFISSISTLSATLSDADGGYTSTGQSQVIAAVSLTSSGSSYGLVNPSYVLNTSGTTLYLVARAQFSAGAITAYGAIWATRIA